MDLTNKTIVVTGGTRGLGAGVVQALAARSAQVIVIARSPSEGADDAGQGGIEYVPGDIIDAALARRIIHDRSPHAIVLNAGAIAPTVPIDVIEWETFSRPWEVDVRGALVWIQACLNAPMPPGGRLLTVSSGAALNGSPLSGGYAGAKRMLWLMSNYAHALAAERDLNLSFRSILPLQMVLDTGVGDIAADAYARRMGVDLATFMARFGEPLTPVAFGNYVADILSGRERTARAYGVKGDVGLTVIESEQL